MVSSLASWLERNGLGQYLEVLTRNDVDLGVLPHLSEDDLTELGFSLGHRRKLQTALRKDPGEAQTAATERLEDRTDAAERRQLTVMFCDLVGSTELAERIDPEDLRALLGRYRDTVAAAVTAADGHVAKLLGDGVLAYFGWPRAHEEDAERAVRAALAAVRDVGAMTTGDRTLAARVGVATGPVVVGDMVGSAAQEAGAVTGATPNLAARLQALAGPGEVVISAATRRLLGGSFDLESTGTHVLKGIAEPAEVWRVLRAARAGSRFEAQRGSGLTELVGRAHEIGLVRDRWSKARRGEGQVVLIAGEAGIGKSRILREFTEKLAGEDGSLLHYQCSPHEINAAFHPIVSEIESAAGILPDDPADLRVDRLEAHLASVFDDAVEVAPLFAALLDLPLDRYPPLEMSPLRRKQRTIALLIRRIQSLAKKHPVVLAVEDVHWVDPSSLETLDALVECAQDLPALAILTYRPDFSAPWTDQGHVTELSLNRLGRDEGSAIIERLAGGKTLPEEVARQILEQTDGVPLFVEELTKAVIESDMLSEEADRYVLDGPLPALAIPTTLHDSLMARLDRLAPVRTVIQAAACIGREFTSNLLSAAVRSGEDELEAALEQLLDSQLIFRRRTASEPTFVFKHALVQDAAYSSLLNSTRQSLHARLARAIEATPNPDSLLLARHFSGADEMFRAGELFLAAGRRSLTESALLEAIGALEIGLGKIERIPGSTERDRLELDLRVALGAARMANFGWAHPSVSEALEPAFPLADSCNDHEALGSILWGLWVHCQTRTNFRRAHEWLAALADSAARAPSSNLPVVHDMCTGCQHFWEADYARALAHTDHLSSIYDRDAHAGLVAMTNHDPMVFAQHWAGSLADWISGRPDCAVERLEEALSLARSRGHPFNSTFAMTAGATCLLYRGEYERMLDLVDEAERIVEAEALGPFALEVLVHQWRGAALTMMGRFGEGHVLVCRGNDFWNASGGRVCNAMFRSWIATGLMALGRVDDAMETVDATIRHCRETGDCFMEPECVRLYGEAELAAGETRNAEARFHEAIELARRHGAKSWELRAATSLARYLRSQGHHGEAQRVLAPIQARFAEGQGTSDLQRAAEILGSLA